MANGSGTVTRGRKPVREVVWQTAEGSRCPADRGSILFFAIGVKQLVPKATIKSVPWGPISQRCPRGTIGTKYAKNGTGTKALGQPTQRVPGPKETN